MLPLLTRLALLAALARLAARRLGRVALAPRPVVVAQLVGYAADVLRGPADVHGEVAHVGAGVAALAHERPRRRRLPVHLLDEPRRGARIQSQRLAVVDDLAVEHQDLVLLDVAVLVDARRLPGARAGPEDEDEDEDEERPPWRPHQRPSLTKRCWMRSAMWTDLSYSRIAASCSRRAAAGSAARRASASCTSADTCRRFARKNDSRRAAAGRPLPRYSLPRRARASRRTSSASGAPGGNGTSSARATAAMAVSAS